jgi:hypothetical protein
MRHLLSLSLASVAALSVVGCVSGPHAVRYSAAPTLGGSRCSRLAQPGNEKIQIVCSGTRLDYVWPIDAPTRRLPALTPVLTQAQASQKSCRQLIAPGEQKVRTACGDIAWWDAFDTWAVTAGVTCRWARTPQELCLNAEQWNNFDKPLRISPAGSGW